MSQVPAPPYTRSDTLDFAVAGVGASAGGLNALIQLFEAMPHDADIAFVVVVHLSPEHVSRVPELLQKATRMPVREVVEAVAIKPNHVYVIPPNRVLRMHDGKLEAVPRRSRSMTIDLFLETLSEVHAHRGIGIILSGTGSDGTLGTRAVKAHGGVTFAQAPEEAEFDAMPRNAIGSGTVDFVLPVREIPAKLVSLWRNARAIRMPKIEDRPTAEDAAAEAEEAVRDIIATVRARTGHDFSQYKRTTLLRRFERRLQVNQLRDLSSYRELLTAQPGESRSLLRDLLISVTSFFRDANAFAAIEKQIVPALFARNENEPIRIWVVGCATGEEVYSLVMLLSEYASTMTNPAPISVFATDIDEEALAFARTGLYPDTIAEQMTPERLRRFFVREGSGYRIAKHLREMVMFAVHNVIQDPPFSRVDLVSCRNVLIYLNRHLQSKVLDLLHFALRPDGTLILGMSESVEDGHDGFLPIDKTHRIFAQQPRARMGMTVGSLPPVHNARLPAEMLSAGGRRLVGYGELHHRMLEHYAPPSLVVDDRLDIVHLSDNAGHYLRFTSGEPSMNLFKAAVDELRYELKGAVEQAMRAMRTVDRKGLPFRRGPMMVSVDVKVHPIRDKSSARTYALIIFTEPSGESPPPARPEPRDDDNGSIALEQRLHDMEAQLRTAVEQYEVQNEELKASNEELQATNEELRATTEELETGKEELQSINEELSTVNQELKNKVDETTRVSDDLHNFITATGIAALFIDRDMRVMRYTPYARQVFNLIPTDLGRPLMDITHRLIDLDLAATIAHVFETLHQAEHEVRSNDDRWFIVRVLPYRTNDDRIRGAVVTLVDITQRRRVEARGQRSAAWAELVVDSVHDYAILTLDEHGVIKTWNAGAEIIFGYSASEIIGQPFELLFTPEDRAAGVPDLEMRTARQVGRAEDERWQLRKDGTTFFASGIAAPLDDPEQKGYVKLLRDLTAQRMASQRRDELLAQERRIRSAAEEANQTKDEFLATLSHELRNPLALILMQSEILTRAPELKRTPRLAAAADVINQTVRAQSKFVDDLLDVSRARTGKLTIDRQLVPLPFLIADSIGALRHEADANDITLEVELPKEPIIIAADAVRVKQIAWNLLSNAIKFTPQGGRVSVRLVREGEQVRLDVEDTGEGISREAMPMIFEWFKQVDSSTTRKRGGMGIGLALVKQLVELHGGRVEAFSEGRGKGARFTVYLPAQDGYTPAGSRGAAPANTAVSRLSGVRLLVIDDAAGNADAMRELLQLEGAAVAIETTAREAIRRAQQETFDVIISDIAMPEMDGYTMLAKLRDGKLNRDSPAIAYSGYGGPEEIERSRKAGFQLHMVKPVDLDRLVESIEKLYRTKSASAQ